MSMSSSLISQPPLSFFQQRQEEHTDRYQRNITVLRETPLNFPALLSLLVVTTINPNTDNYMDDPAYLRDMYDYQGEQTRKLGRQEITGEVFVNNIINISNRDLTLLQQSEGTTATLNYLQEAASQLLPRIMSRLAAIRSKTEDPALLRDYQKALFELIPYFAVVDLDFAHFYEFLTLKKLTTFVDCVL